MSGLAVAVGVGVGVGVGVVLGRVGQGGGQPPTADQRSADDSVVDAELPALQLDALFGRPCCIVDLGGVARVGVDQYQLADFMQHARQGEMIAVFIVELDGDLVGDTLRGQGVQPEALRCAVPHAGVLEEIEGGNAAGERVDSPGPQQLDGGEGCIGPATNSSSMSRLAVSIRRVPPSGIASRALTARLTRICLSCPGSIRTQRRSGSNDVSL